jgi:hypothetical protein
MRELVELINNRNPKTYSVIHFDGRSLSSYEEAKRINDLDPLEVPIMHYLFTGASMGRDTVEGIIEEVPGTPAQIRGALMRLERKGLLKVVRLGPVETWKEKRV